MSNEIDELRNALEQADRARKQAENDLLGNGSYVI